MKTAILHLSDIHFKEENNSVFEKIEAIRGVLSSWCSEHEDLKSCFIVVSGDIASSGSSKEYKNAIEFFQALKSSIKSLAMFSQVEYVFVPGNHDCNLQNTQKIREVLIKSIVEKDLQIDELDDYAIDSLTLPQREFFEFLSKFFPNVEVTGHKRLYYEIDFTVVTSKIKFKCYNTSFLSQQKEQQGQVAFPLSKIPKNSEECTLVCAIFHHPYNWFESSNARYFREHVEETADIVFTGHEHALDSYSRRRITGEISEYMEGGILQEEDGVSSSFNGVVIDLENRIQKKFQWNWSGDIYKEIQSTDWDKLCRPKSASWRFENCGSFREYIEELGVGFTHRHADRIRLSDVFVYPDLKEIVLKSSSAEIPYETLGGEKLIESALNCRHLLLIGSDRSGKTSLLKMLYSGFLSRGCVPLLIKGESITSSNPEKMARLIHESFLDQYSQNMLEQYKQLPRIKKVLLIDDLDKSRLNQKGRIKFLNFLQNAFEVVLASCTDLVKLEEFTSHIDKSLLSFKHCEIAEFGHLLRGKLIEKWVSLGEEDTASESELSYKVRIYENEVNRIIQVKLLPSNPFVILTILQMIEAREPLDTASGSYGFLYECVITKAIAKGSILAIELQNKYTLLSELAYYMFDRVISQVAAAQIREIDDILYEKLDVRLNSQRLTDQLVQVNILSVHGGYYAFKYQYLYYYFAARYMRDNLRDPKEGVGIQQRIEVMTRNLFREDYANIMIFLSYLSKDPLIYDAMLKNARDIFKEYGTCDLDKDVSYINILQPSKPKLLIEEKSTEETREEILRAKDEVYSLLDDDDTTCDAEDVVDIEDLDPLLKLNVAFKTVEILGQILRNFPTSLRKEIKLGLAKECYSLGLRTLKVFLGTFNENLDEIRIILGEFIREEQGIKDEQEISKRVNQFTFFIPLSLAFAVIKKISYSVGSEQLEETYRRVLSESSSIAVRLVDISIRLDHFQHVPVDDIVVLHMDLKGNYFSSMLLSILVVENMFMYRWDRAMRQSTLTRLQIVVKTPKLIESPSKKLPRN